MELLVDHIICSKKVKQEIFQELRRLHISNLVDFLKKVKEQLNGIYLEYHPKKFIKLCENARILILEDDLLFCHVFIVVIDHLKHKIRLISFKF